MKHVYAKGCRMHRRSEGLEGLLTSRGRAMDQHKTTQAFNWVKTYPQEAPSTA